MIRNVVYPLIVAAMLAAATVCDAQRWPAATAAVAKLYGAGGLAGIEAYQTGLLVSQEGHILTPNTLVLDQGEVTVVLHDGSRYSGVVMGADPISDLAVIVIDAGGTPLMTFDLDGGGEPAMGDTAYVLSNIFGIATGDEPVSVQTAVVATVAPLRAQLPSGERIEGPDVVVLDAVTSNPGSAGGAVVDERGRLLGMLGREMRSSITGAWFNYAIPAVQLRLPYQRIVQGKTIAAPGPLELGPIVDTLDTYGFAMVPEIVRRTPPFIDFVEPGSLAADAGLRPDDLIVSIDGLLGGSVAEARRLLTKATARDAIDMLVQRDGQLVEIQLTAAKNEPE